MAVRVAINGFGRIGRALFRAIADDVDIDVVAVNDLGDKENLVYLLKYDSALGQALFDIKLSDEGFHAGRHDVQFLSNKDPKQLPWEDLKIDIVIESTGVFTSYESAGMHVDAGARRVVITAPAKGKPVAGIEGATVLMGVNEGALKTCTISSNASCTTNAGSPIIQIFHESIGIEKAMLNTVHAYTASQSIVDGPHSKDVRRGRAAAQNIVPSSTGAARATTEAIPSLDGRFDGIALRVPVIVGSIVDLTFLAQKKTHVEEVNDIVKSASRSDRWKDLLSYTEEPLVSSDIIGSPYASIADLSMTRVVDEDLVKVLAWYDNETGYVHSLVRHIKTITTHM